MTPSLVNVAPEEMLNVPVLEAPPSLVPRAAASVTVAETASVPPSTIRWPGVAAAGGVPRQLSSLMVSRCWSP
jgi:hypothetical protein